MPTHLCIDCRLIGTGGIGTYLKSCLTALHNSAHYRLTLLGQRSDLPQLLPFSSAIVPMRSPIYTIAEQFEYVVKIPPCDLFWAPHFNIPLLPIRAQKRITTIHDVYHLAYRAHLPFLQKAYATLFYNSAFLFSDEIMTVSHFSKSEILKYAFIKPKSLRVVSQGFCFEAAENKQEKKNFILAVGNVKVHKNLHRLIKAYALLRPKEDLYIVGRKEGLISLDKKLFYAVENDSFLKHHVFFTGYVSEEELKMLYASAKLFVFPSLYEGFGYPPLEAMASECPVVASRAGAIPEKCAEAVEYIDPYSVESIAEGIERVLKNGERRDELQRLGRELIRKRRGEMNNIVEGIDACCSRT
jgi:glycosyltransferase involved in cell wall biosynthesis